MEISAVLIARLLMADELDYTVNDLLDMYASETSKPASELDLDLIEELTLAIAEASEIDDEVTRRDNAKWLVLNRILDNEIAKPEEDMNTNLIDEILDYLDEKGWL